MLYICLIILVLVFPIFSWFIFAYYSQKKWRKISEEPNNSENTINEQNNGDLVGEYGSTYGGGDFEESGVSGGDRVKTLGLTRDYGSGEYGGNYRGGNEVGSSVYGEGENSKIDGNSGKSGITGVRY